jgi:hypothetical protein
MGELKERSLRQSRPQQAASLKLYLSAPHPSRSESMDRFQDGNARLTHGPQLRTRRALGPARLGGPVPALQRGAAQVPAPAGRRLGPPSALRRGGCHAAAQPPPGGGLPHPG